MNYSFIIDEFTWSFSRIKQYEMCPYGFFLKYIKNKRTYRKHFFASYGSLMHDILAEYYRGNLTSAQCKQKFLLEFTRKIRHLDAPSPKVQLSYFNDGLSHMSDITIKRDGVELVEKKFNFEFANVPCIGFVDLVKQCEDGRLVIVDHKSGNIKPRSNRKKATLSDQDLDDKLHQLYMYSLPVSAIFGRLPDELWFNCLRSRTVVAEPYKTEKMQETQNWLAESVDKIRNEEEWDPDPEWFKCRFLCDMCDVCEYAEHM